MPLPELGEEREKEITDVQIIVDKLMEQHKMHLDSCCGCGEFWVDADEMPWRRR